MPARSTNWSRGEAQAPGEAAAGGAEAEAAGEAAGGEAAEEAGAAESGRAAARSTRPKPCRKAAQVRQGQQPRSGGAASDMPCMSYAPPMSTALSSMPLGAKGAAPGKRCAPALVGCASAAGPSPGPPDCTTRSPQMSRRTSRGVGSSQCTSGRVDSHASAAATSGAPTTTCSSRPRARSTGGQEGAGAGVSAVALPPSELLTGAVGGEGGCARSWAAVRRLAASGSCQAAAMAEARAWAEAGVQAGQKSWAVMTDLATLPAHNRTTNPWITGNQ
ncbi:hypothetical protein TSOC_001005 [Tetrabaena socialis]|uniref:Uncharacterized protein n=1 Tax=Tetrabaena socialis TaxID=47790 RepID=A0A2J8AHT5_9CHLO|nr:hypothetical protein TSOC_001005 [Tetrabaena socialis]|eukprot:PNH12067.1 hypothetical protein TSOC_001005 [Tetrabaena socialis]